MKLLPFLPPVLLAAFALPSLALDAVGVAVQVRTVGTASDGGGPVDTQKRSLAITLTNRTREDLAGLAVKWAIFASGLKSGDIGKAGSGQIKSSLSASATEEVRSETATMKYTPRHAETDTHKDKNPFNDGNNRNKNRQRMVKIVEAKGDRYRGWGVQVLRGGSVVGEAYSTPELKSRM